MGKRRREKRDSAVYLCVVYACVHMFVCVNVCVFVRVCVDRAMQCGDVGPACGAQVGFYQQQPE